MFQWTRRKQFWQPCQKVSDKKAKKFSIFSKTKKNVPSKTKTSSKISYGHAESSFDKHAAKNSDENAKIIRPLSERFEKKILLRNIRLLKTFHWTPRMQFWQPSQKNFVRTPENFSYNSKKINKCKSLKNNYPGNVSLDT